MDRREYWRRYLEELFPFVGVIFGVWALSLSMSALAAGIEHGSLAGYVSGSGSLLAGYVAFRRAWQRRADSVFYGAIAAILILTVYVVLAVETPPGMFEQVAST